MHREAVALVDKIRRELGCREGTNINQDLLKLIYNLG